MKKQKNLKWINIIITSIMLISTILTPQISHALADMQAEDEEETTEVEPTDMDTDAINEEPTEDIDDNSGEGDSAEVVDVDGESEPEEATDETQPVEDDEVGSGEPEDVNANSPPVEAEADAEENENKIKENDNKVQSSKGKRTTFSELSREEIIFENILFTDTDGNEFSASNPYDLEANETGRLSFDWSLPEGHSVTGGDTYTFNLPAEFTPVSGTSGNLGDVGQWTVNANGVVTFTFNGNVDGDDVNGNFWFDISLVEEELEDTIEQEVTFPIGPEDYTINFNVQPKGGSLIDKTGTINNEGYNSDKAYWEIDINTGLEELINPSVTDKIPANMEFQENSLVVYSLNVNLSGERTESNQLDTNKYNISIDDNGNPTIVFHNLTEEEANQAYRIKYTTDIVEPDEGFDGIQTFTNNATLTNDGKSLSTSSTVTSGYGRAIEKGDPEYNSGDQTFDWTINYNFNQKYIDAGQATIEDTWEPVGVMELKDLEIYPVEISSDGTPAVSSTPLPANQYTLAKKDDNSGFSLSFNNAIDGQAYQIRYKTNILGRHKDGIIDSGGNVTNTVETGTEMTDGSSGSWGQQGIIKKRQNTDVNAKTINWEIQLNQNGYTMENLVLEDDFMGDGLTLIENKENHSDYELMITDNDGNEFTGYEINYREPSDGTPGGFTIEFTETINEPLTLSYTTHFERNSDGTATYGNNANINWHEGGREYESETGEIEHTPEGHTAANGVKNGRYNATNKQITWTINTNYARLPIESPYVIADQLPEHQVYVEESLEVYSYEVTANGTITNEVPLEEGTYTVSYPTEDGNKLRVTLDDEEHSNERTAIGLRFNTEFANEWVREGLVKNTAVVTNGEDSFGLEASLEIPYGGEYAGKSGEQAGEFNERVDWTILMNPAQSRISNYTLTDTPDLNSVLMEDTFIVYEADVDENGTVRATGNELEVGTDYNLEITTNNETGQQQFILRFTKEINQAYVLEYSSYIDPLAPQDTEITNDYIVEGENIEIIETTEKSTIVTKQNAGGGDGTSTRGGLTIQKENKANERLAGATFELYNNDGTQLLRSGITNDEGQLTFGGLRRGTYLLKETSAPEGYVINNELAEGIKIELTHNEEGDLEVFVYENRLTEVDVHKVDEDGNLINKPASFDIYDATNDSLVRQNVETNEGAVTVEDLEPGEYYLLETSAPDGYIRNTEQIPFTVEINDDGTQNVPTISVVNYRGNAQVLKRDEAGNPLGGAVFRLENNQDETVKTDLTSNDEGIIRIENLSPGKYRLIETQPAEGYIRNTEELSIRIPAAVQGEPETFSFGEYTNYLGKVRLTKTDEDGNPLAGAVYEIRNAENEVVRENLTTEDDGRLFVDGLTPGKYEFVEVVAPAGFVADTTPISFTIKATAEGNPVIVNAGQPVNYQGSVKLQKTDANDNPLVGAEFNLYEVIDEQRVLLDTFSSNSKGLVEVDKLAPGNYVFVESSAPEDYLINTEEIKFEINDKALGRPVRVEAGQAINYQGSVTLQKTDAEGNPLAGATFEIRDSERNLIQSDLVSDADGFVEAEGLAPGDYIFIETSAPDGYILNETEIPFTIDAEAEGEPSQVNAGKAINYQGAVEWQKVNESEAPLTDAVFNLLDEDGNIIREDMTSNEEGTFLVEDLEPGTYAIIEEGAADGYLLNTQEVEFTIGESHEGDPGITTLNEFVNYQGSAQIIKVNAKNEVLSGAIFEVRDADENVVDTLTSDENGRVLVNDLAPGDYTFVEISSPDGYITNTEPIEFAIDVKAEGKPEIVNVGNAINYQGSVTLQKTDAEDNPLAGATFEIRDLEGNIIQSKLVSNEDGLVEAEDLAPGNYVFVETKAPEGYVLNEARISFEIKPEAAGEPVRVSAGVAVNYKGSAVLEKQDVNGNALENAVFEIRDIEGNVVKSNLISDKDGLVYADELAPGDYKFVETSAPEGYILNEVEIPFTIVDSAENEPNVEDAGKVVNYQGSVEWLKVDENGSPLAGVEFSVYEADGNVAGENLQSNEDGLISLAGLAPGLYTIVETATVDGYILNTEVSEFEIPESALSEPDVIVADNFVNYQGKVLLTKTDVNGEPLEGAVFNLQLGEEVIAKDLITDENGQIFVENLTPGSYTFVEVSAPEDYIIDSTPIKFDVAEEYEGEPVVVTVGDIVNYQGSVSLEKVDVDGNPLAGAIFELRDENNNRLRNDLVSDEEGVVTITGLAPGDYVIKEIKAPEGYVLNTNSINFTIESISEGKPEMVFLGEFMNYQGTVELIKTDKDGNPLEGAEFSILDTDGNTIQTDLVSNSSGRIIVTGLAPGKYSLIETKAPAGYVLSDENYSFEITTEAEGEPATVRLTIINDEEPEDSEDPAGSEESDDDSVLPKTGEAASYTLLALILVGLGFGLRYYSKRRTN